MRLLYICSFESYPYFPHNPVSLYHQAFSLSIFCFSHPSHSMPALYPYDILFPCITAILCFLLLRLSGSLILCLWLLMAFLTLTTSVSANKAMSQDQPRFSPFLCLGGTLWPVMRRTFTYRDKSRIGDNMQALKWPAIKLAVCDDLDFFLGSRMFGIL